MEDHAAFFALLTRLLPALPPLLVCVAGALTAAIYWRDCREPATMVLIAVVLIGLGSLAGPLISAYLLDPSRLAEMHKARLGVELTTLNLSVTALHTVGLILLLVAVFYRRRPATISPLPPPR